MRIHSIVAEVARTPIQDDILPLAKPIVGTSGRVYTELPVPKGTFIYVSIAGYNLYISSAKPQSPRQSAYSIVLMAGTRICGAQTLMSSDRSVGSKWTNQWNHPLGCMGTCTVMYGVPMGPLSIDFLFTQLYILRRRQGLPWVAICVR